VESNDIEDVWNDRLLYALYIGGRNYSIGDRIPLHMTLVPLDKVALHQISVVLEQRVTYRTRDGIHEDKDTSRFPLLSIKQARKAIPILPVLPNSPPDSLSVLCHSESGNPDVIDEEYIHQLQSLSGPWSLRYSIPLRDESGLHFTFDRRPNSVIEVEHNLHITLVVRALDDPTSNSAPHATSSSDIKLVYPVQILSSHCTPAWIKLPTYCDVPQPNSADPYAYLLQGGISGHSRHEAGDPSASDISPDTSAIAANRDLWPPPNLRQLPSKDASQIPVTHDSDMGKGKDLASAEHARRFAKLIGGREGVNGELPPDYGKEFHSSDSV